MKNIYVLPSNSPSKLWRSTASTPYLVLDKFFRREVEFVEPKNLYIISNERIKDGDYALNTRASTVIKQHPEQQNTIEHLQGGQIRYIFKIILTTDLLLIKGGVQEVPTEFLEWFVKNPNCKGVEYDTNYNRGNGKYYYKIIIPSEERK
jgi:hypothetical protein